MTLYKLEDIIYNSIREKKGIVKDVKEGDMYIVYTNEVYDATTWMRLDHVILVARKII